MTDLIRRADADKIEFKDQFIERYKSLTDWEEFKKYSLSHLKKCIRINSLKCDIQKTKTRLESKGWKLTPVPWCKEGFWMLGDRLDFGNLLEHVLGYFYVQEAASMIPPVVLDPKPGETVLDMCAAPGSKTTQMAQYMENKGLLVANDVTAVRLAALGINIQRCGVLNVMTTQMQGFRIKGLEFDRVLVDAPCSGTGTVRKSLKTLDIWSPKLPLRLAATQRKLIRTGFELLKPGGTMVYSTCTMEPEENEGIINYLLNNFENAKIEKIDLPIKRSPAVTEFLGQKYNPEVKNCLRIWPQDNNTEGFFVTKIKKLN